DLSNLSIHVSSPLPFSKTTSACESAMTSDGVGSYVSGAAPTGTSAVMSMESPPTSLTIAPSVENVAITRSRAAGEAWVACVAVSTLPPHAVRARAAMVASATDGCGKQNLLARIILCKCRRAGYACQGRSGDLGGQRRAPIRREDVLHVGLRLCVRRHASVSVNGAGAGVICSQG